MTALVPAIAALALALLLALGLFHRRKTARLEQALRKSQAALAEQTRHCAVTLQEMEGVSYAISHDLRSPLRIVEGFANIVIEDYGDRLDDIGRGHLQRIASAATRMNRMIDALLGMAQRTNREIRREDVDLSGLGREVADELHASDPTRKVQFEIAPGLHANGDPVLLRIVLQNLLGNAFKFTANVVPARVAFGCAADGEHDTPVYFVRDNGAGFDMRFAGRIFGLFQRLHPQNEFPGTGIGLATVQRIVHKHEGTIRAEAEPGKGACFYFTLQGGSQQRAAITGEWNVGEWN